MHSGPSFLCSGTGSYDEDGFHGNTLCRPTELYCRIYGASERDVSLCPGELVKQSDNLYVAIESPRKTATRDISLLLPRNCETDFGTTRNLASFFSTMSPVKSVLFTFGGSTIFVSLPSFIIQLFYQMQLMHKLVKQFTRGKS